MDGSTRMYQRCNYIANPPRLIHGQSTSPPDHPDTPTRPRDLLILAAVIEHPEMGLILYETGSAEGFEIPAPVPISDMFPRIVYKDENKLPAAIKATGNDIKDVKAVVFGHLHIDHAGGLEHFIDTDTPIYVHEEEFQHACMAAATRTDNGVYSAEYMDFSKLNWQPFFDDRFELCQGITMHLARGHTPGLCVMQVNLEKDGTFIWTSDMYLVAEHYEMSHPQPWLVKDQNAWVRSHRMIQQLERLFQAKLIFGRDKETAEKFMSSKKYYE